jgi:hypothetical protein
MNPEHWKEIKRLFDEARALERPERDLFLAHLRKTASPRAQCFFIDPGHSGTILTSNTRQGTLSHCQGTSTAAAANSVELTSEAPESTYWATQGISPGHNMQKSMRIGEFINANPIAREVSSV